MIEVKATPKLLGVLIKGSYNDFDELVDCIHRLTHDYSEDPSNLLYGVAMRMLGLCYDIRHAIQGDRNMEIVETEDYIEKIGQKKVPKHKMVYSCEILFTEAMFFATAVPKTMVFVQDSYVAVDNGMFSYHHTKAQYLRDKAYVDLLCGCIWNALEEVIGKDDCDLLINQYLKGSEYYFDFVSQYLDKCNIEYERTPIDKRKVKIRNITKRLIKFPTSYYRMKSDLEYWAKQYDCSIHDLQDSRYSYPKEEPEW